MASSGRVITSNISGDYLSVEWSVQTTDIAASTSTIIANLFLNNSTGVSRRISDTQIIIDGETFTFPDSHYSSSGFLKQYTKTISHDEYGEKTFSISISTVFDKNLISQGHTLTGSATFMLDTLDYSSDFVSVTSGSLGTEQFLYIKKAKSYVKDTITYECGTVTDTVVDKSTLATIPFTPPISLSAQNTTGTKVTIKYTLTSYVGNEQVGEVKEQTVQYTIPASLKPTISSFTLAEAVESLSEQFSVYVNGKSRISFSSVSAGAYGSTIRSYSVSIAGQYFASPNGTTAVIDVPVGSNTAKITVTDSRGRTATQTASFTVAEYSAPQIFSLVANRTTDGEIDDSGEVLRLAVNYLASPINDENTVTVSIGYRLAGTTGNFIPLVSTIPDDTYIYNSFELFNKSGDPVFDAGNSYEIQFILTDFFNSVSDTVFLTMGGFAGGTTFNFVNARGEALPLSSNNYFHLIAIDGLTTANADLSSLSLGNADGDIVNNAKAQPRPLSLTLKIKEGVNVKEAKSSILQKVKLKQVASIEWFEGSKHVVISGTVESIDMPRFENGIAMQIALHCSNPYWEDYNNIITAETTITNEGDVETGIIFTLTATGAVTNPTITTDNGEIFGIGYGTGAKMVTLSSGDVLTVDTRQGNKSVKLNTTTNLIAFVKPQSVWHQLMTGENEFIFDDNITPSITYKQKYI